MYGGADNSPATPHRAATDLPTAGTVRRNSRQANAAGNKEAGSTPPNSKRPVGRPPKVLALSKGKSGTTIPELLNKRKRSPRGSDEGGNKRLRKVPAGLGAPSSSKAMSGTGGNRNKCESTGSPQSQSSTRDSAAAPKEGNPTQSTSPGHMDGAPSWKNCTANFK